MTGARVLPAPDGDTRRISLRRVEASGRASDVVGHLIAANDEWLVVLPEERPVVWVPRAEARQIREVPERTVLPASPAEPLERVLDLTWPGLRRGRLGGWVLRSGRGRTNRANSVLAAGDPGVGFDEAIAAAAQWYGAPATLQAVDGGSTAREALDAGYLARTPTLVMVREAVAEAGPETRIAARPDRGWLSVLRGGDVDPDRLAELTAAPADYLSLGDDAVGRVALARSWAVLSCIEVRPEARGRGLGRDVTRALMATAARHGARYLALQVEADNAAAVGLYRSLGFVTHHGYSYLVPA